MTMQRLLIPRSSKIPGLIILGILCLTVMCNGAPAYDKTSPKEKILLRYRAKGNEELCYLVSAKNGRTELPVTILLLASLTQDKQGLFCIRQKYEELLAPMKSLPTSKGKEFYLILPCDADPAHGMRPKNTRPVYFRNNLGIPIRCSASGKMTLEEVEQRSIDLHKYYIDGAASTPVWIPVVLAEKAVQVGDTWRKKVPAIVGMARGMDFVFKPFDIPVECKLTAIETLEGTETKCAVIEYGYEATGRETDFNPKWLGTWRIKRSGRAWFAIDRGIVVKKVEKYELTKDFDKSPPQGDFSAKVEYEATLLNMYCPKARQAIPSAHGRKKAKGRADGLSPDAKEISDRMRSLWQKERFQELKEYVDKTYAANEKSTPVIPEPVCADTPTIVLKVGKVLHLASEDVSTFAEAFLSMPASSQKTILKTLPASKALSLRQKQAAMDAVFRSVRAEIVKRLQGGRPAESERLLSDTEEKLLCAWLETLEKNSFLISSEIAVDLFSTLHSDYPDGLTTRAISLARKNSWLCSLEELDKSDKRYHIVRLQFYFRPSKESSAMRLELGDDRQMAEVFEQARRALLTKHTLSPEVKAALFTVCQNKKKGFEARATGILYLLLAGELDLAEKALPALERDAHETGKKEFITTAASLKLLNKTLRETATERRAHDAVPKDAKPENKE